MKRILIVDDVATDRLHLMKILGPLGYDIHEAENGKMGIEMTKRLKPDVVFMDVVMPEMSGFQACREITRDPELKGIPVVIVSSKNRAPDEMNGRVNGASGYIFKPAEEAQVMAKLKELKLV